MADFAAMPWQTGYDVRKYNDNGGTMDQHQPDRQNHVMADDVETALRIEQSSGAANAWVYMAHKAVPRGVIKRVLAFPKLRRKIVKIK